MGSRRILLMQDSAHSPYLSREEEAENPKPLVLGEGLSSKFGQLKPQLSTEFSWQVMMGIYTYIYMLYRDNGQEHGNYNRI